MTRHLAELNIGRLIAHPEDPAVAEFMEALDKVNGIGKRSPGFVWMMEGSGEPGTGNTENHIGDDPQFVANLTVWEDAESLKAFVWNTVHRQFFQRRLEWFEPAEGPNLVFWWVEPGHRPDLAEGLVRLEQLKTHGPGPEAFGWNDLAGSTQD